MRYDAHKQRDPQAWLELDEYSVLLRLMALRMLKCDEHRNPTLTDLAEAALERMRRQAPLVTASRSPDS